MSKVRVAVLVSGSGSNLQALLDRQQSLYEIVLVVSNRKAAYGLERAKKAGVETLYIGNGNYPDKVDQDRALEVALSDKAVDLVVLAGYLNIISPQLVKTYDKRIINIHPSLIPDFCGPGFYGLKVHEAVIEAKALYSGATTHYVDAGVDTGDIIKQERVLVDAEDTAETLQHKVLKIEHKLLVETVMSCCEALLEEAK